MAATKIAAATTAPVAASPVSTAAADKKINVNVKAAAKAVTAPAVKAEPNIAPADAAVDAEATVTDAGAEVPVDERIVAAVASIAEDVATIEGALTTTLKDLKAKVKAVQRDLAKYRKASAAALAAASKRRGGSKASAGQGSDATRKTSGFQKPTGVSDQLADFLKIPRGSLLPRMDVTRKINEYIRENNLQNPSDRRKIVPNAELHAILGTTAESEVSYFNYQGFLKGHFVAPAPAASTTA